MSSTEEVTKKAIPFLNWCMGFNQEWEAQDLKEFLEVLSEAFLLSELANSLQERDRYLVLQKGLLNLADVLAQLTSSSTREINKYLLNRTNNELLS